MDTQRRRPRPDAGTDLANRGWPRDRSGSGIPDAGQRGTPVTAVVPQMPVGTLLLYSKGLDRRKVELYRDAHLSAATTLQAVDSWTEILTAINKYKSIDKLVFLVHSNPGAFLFGPDAREE